ncbi:hypothetical protein BDN67DRAFT_1072834 [Paxillus ammoniavirescens]|nr:hypothetical protein BDN67DRAFT_1072834 [Paxillus ammoniavirescens]
MAPLFAGRLGIEHHPDKNPSNPHSEESFKGIVIFYQTLSGAELRKKMKTAL